MGPIRVDKPKKLGANNDYLFHFWSNFHVNWGCPSLLFGETTSHLTSKWRGIFQYFFLMLKIIHTPSPPRIFFLHQFFFFNVGNSMKREENFKCWKKYFFNFIFFNTVKLGYIEVQGTWVNTSIYKKFDITEVCLWVFISWVSQMSDNRVCRNIQSLWLSFYFLIHCLTQHTICYIHGYITWQNQWHEFVV